MTLSYFDRRDHEIYAEPFYKVKELPVFFYSIDCFDIIQKVIDDKGNIINFPGIVEDERIENERRVKIFKDIRYEASFKKLENNTYLMEWLIQPNGMYWMDEDGFGIEDDQLISLYSIIDSNGRFIKPFELYQIGNVKYANE